MGPASDALVPAHTNTPPKLVDVKTSRRWVLYSLLRVGIFVAVFALLMTLNVEPWLAAVAAAVVGLCVSYIFFRPQREALSLSLQRFRQSAQRDDDSDAENSALDLRDAPKRAAGGPGPAADSDSNSDTGSGIGIGIGKAPAAPLKRESGGETQPEN